MGAIAGASCSPLGRVKKAWARYTLLFALLGFFWVTWTYFQLLGALWEHFEFICCVEERLGHQRCPNRCQNDCPRQNLTHRTFGCHLPYMFCFSQKIYRTSLLFVALWVAALHGVGSHAVEAYLSISALSKKLFSVASAIFMHCTSATWHAAKLLRVTCAPRAIRLLGNPCRLRSQATLGGPRSEPGIDRPN